MKLVFFFDYVSPPSYINFKYLEKLLSKRSDIELEFINVELNPSYHGEEYIYKFVAKKYQCEEVDSFKYFETLGRHLQKMNININFNNMILRNGHFAHLVAKYCKKINKELKWHQIVFDYYYTLQKDISDQEIILEMAQQIGIDNQIILDIIHNNHFNFQLQKDIAYAKKLKISGVPIIKIDDQMISGVVDLMHLEFLISTLCDKDEKEVKIIGTNVCNGNFCD